MFADPSFQVKEKGDQEKRLSSGFISMQVFVTLGQQFSVKWFVLNINNRIK
jgi:hypothetical protein